MNMGRGAYDTTRDVTSPNMGRGAYDTTGVVQTKTGAIHT